MILLFIAGSLPLKQLNFNNLEVDGRGDFACRQVCN